METFSGLVYVKHGSVGTRSEGPDYFLQTCEGDLGLVYQKRNHQDLDYHLEYFCRRIVEVRGEMTPERRVDVKEIRPLCAALIPGPHDVFTLKITNGSSGTLNNLSVGMIGCSAEHMSVDKLLPGESSRLYVFSLGRREADGVRPISYGDWTGTYWQSGVQRMLHVPGPRSVTIRIKDNSYDTEVQK
jgi:hypothetical protein